MKYLKNLFLLLSLVLTSSCSVVMAAKHDGLSIEKVQTCKTRSQLMAHGAILVSSEPWDCGGLVEVYEIPMERGSASRAIMHGLLDVSTFGLWEVVGTPLEACSNREFFVIKAYSDTSEVIQKIELL